MKAKKILIVTHYYPPHAGGIEYVAQNQAKALAALGDSVTVLTSRILADKPCSQDKSATIVRVPAFNGFERWGVPFPIFSPSLLISLRREIRRAEVVHIHDAFYISSWCAAILARLYGRPVVLTQHVDLVPHPSRLVRWLQRLVYATAGAMVFRCSATIIILNERIGSFLLARGISGRKIRLIFNGVDDKLFRPAKPLEKQLIRQKYDLVENRKIILFVGRAAIKKGFDKVLAAKNKRYQLVFVGGQASQAESSQVRFLGQLSQPQLAEIYRAADIFVLPAYGEGFPLVIQEAMASGLPVIMSYDDGYDAYKLDQEFVYLLANRPSSDAIRQAILELVDDGARRRRMANHSRDYVRRHFSWPQVARELDQIYAGLLPEVSS